MARVCDGDNDALGVLFRRYARIVRGVAYKVLRDSSEADDMVQEVFLLVRRLCKTFNSSKGSARFWILQMAHHRAISRRRYLTSRHFYTHRDLDQVANATRDSVTRSRGYSDSIQTTIEQRQALLVAFAELSEDQRETLRLYFLEGCSLEEIAARLSQTLGNVKHHYYRGLDRLRRQIFSGKWKTELKPPKGAVEVTRESTQRSNAKTQ